VATHDRAQPAIVVTPSTGKSLDLEVRGHHLVADHPTENGELVRGPEPLDIFVTGLAACVTTFAASYLRRNGFGTAGLSVAAASYTVGDRPTRLTSITIRLTIPAHVPDERRAPLLAMAKHCTAHNSFVRPPVIDIDWA
jgi:putative redox protein